MKFLECLLTALVSLVIGFKMGRAHISRQRELRRHSDLRVVPLNPEIRKLGA